MRRLITAVSLAAIAWGASAPALASSSNYYLRLDDIKGRSAARAGDGKPLEILAWSWGATDAGKYGAVGGMHRDDSLAKPLDRGSVRVKVKFPWLACRVGAAFPDAELQNASGRYELKDAIVTGCAADSVSLNYAKVTVRGWDPEK